MVIGTVETLESLLDGFWKHHKVEVDPEEFDKRRHLASIYSRLVITSFIASSISSYIESPTLSSIARDLSSLSRKLPFSQANKGGSRVDSVDGGDLHDSSLKSFTVFWVPSGPDDYAKFYRLLASYLSRYQDYLETLDRESSSGKLSVTPRDSERFYKSLERSLDYVSFAKKAVSKASPEDLSRISSIVRRLTKNLRLIRDGLFDYKGLVYDLYRSEDFEDVDGFFEDLGQAGELA